MKQLEELERKVQQFVRRMSEVRSENKELKLLHKELQEQNEQLQSSLLKQNDSTASLSKEKDVIKRTIEGFLESIESLESAE